MPPVDLHALCEAFMLTLAFASLCFFLSPPASCSKCSPTLHTLCGGTSKPIIDDCQPQTRDGKVVRPHERRSHPGLRSSRPQSSKRRTEREGRRW